MHNNCLTLWEKASAHEKWIVENEWREGGQGPRSNKYANEAAEHQGRRFSALPKYIIPSSRTPLPSPGVSPRRSTTACVDIDSLTSNKRSVMEEIIRRRSRGRGVASPLYTQDSDSKSNGVKTRGCCCWFS